MAGPKPIALRIDGRDVSALSFPFEYPRGTAVMRVAICVVLAVVLLVAAGTFFVSFSRVESPLLIAARVLIVVVVAVVVPFLILQLQSFRGPAFVALLAEGIYSRTGGARTLVPWEIVTATGPYDFAGCRYLGVRTSRPPGTYPRWLRIFRPLNRRTAGWDLTYPLFIIPAGPALVHLIERCLADPEARATVAIARYP